MLEVDATKVAPKIAEVLSLSGWGIPPLNWSQRRNAAAKTILEGVEDGELFEPQAVRDESMATGVRALLYIWTGWPEDGQMWASAVPEKERLCMTGFALRQMGKIDESKSQLQQLEENPLGNGLACLAKELISDNAEPLLKRFRDLIDLGEAWEAFAFMDLLEQARDGALSQNGQEIVRLLQWQEFNMLFERCYQVATGVDVVKRETEVSVPPPVPAWKRNQANKQRHRCAQTASRAQKSLPPEQATTESGGDTPVSSPQRIAIKCPGCKSTTTVGQSARGLTVKCSKCGNPLRVAAAVAGAEVTAKTTSTLVCPKCRSAATYSIAHRGKKVACLKCRTSFMFAA